MKSVIELRAERDYKVMIDCDWSKELIGELFGRTRAAIIVSTEMKSALGAIPSVDCEIHIFEIPDGENGKTAETLIDLWNWLGAAGFTRSDLIIGIGGGAVTDLAGFAAATWLRGIDWIAIPTSLAAMVDAAIGGKTGINSGYGKNLIGAFNSPIAVFIDLNWLGTLSDRDFAAGMAEVIKCGFIVDTKILELLAGQNVSSVRADSSLTCELISRAVQVKADAVSDDFKDSYGREILNYGHTLGHAIEIDSKFSLRHGEAISIGLIFAAHLASLSGKLELAVVDKHIELLSAFGLPTTYARDAWPRLLPLLYLDKKVRGRSIRFVVLTKIGKTERLEDLNESALHACYEKIST